MSLRLILIFLMLSNIAVAQSDITLEDIWKNNTLSDRFIPGFKFQLDGRHFTRLQSNKIVSYDITTGKQTAILFDAQAHRSSDGFNGVISSYNFSADEKFILIKSENEKIYRRSSKAHYFVYHREDDKLLKLYDGNKQMYATVSPDKEHVAFVVDNNLFIKSMRTGAVDQITKDGVRNQIINGAADWVYEEEFKMSRAFRWSPDGKKIAYLRFDESQVPEYTMMNYRDGLYPEYKTFKYPKVGEKNADVSVHIYDITKLKRVKVDLPKNKEYVPRINWTNSSEKLCVTTLNRHQNQVQLWLANSKNGKSKLLLNEENEYYVSVHDNLSFLGDGKHFIWRSENNGFNHMYLYDMKGREKRDLTPGEFDVTGFYGYDENHQEYFFQAADESPMRRAIYKVSIDGKSKETLSKMPGWNSGQFSSTHDYFVAIHSTINSPPTYRVLDRDGKLIRDLELNQNTRKNQEKYGVRPVEFFDFKTSKNVALNGYMIKPHNFNATKKYPVLMYVYGGPNSQKVVDNWQSQYYWWFQMLAYEGYVVVCVDNRGTGARGEKFRKMTYLKLGHYETMDQIDAAEYLASLRFIDPQRIGIFGWSYGGYVSSLALLKGNGVFKMGIAVAPITNWKWYDTVYTERFMMTEKENREGFQNNSPVYFADRLTGKYLLVHGGADDNVHVQNSMEMSAALIRANKQFDVCFYPNNAHGIRNGNARLHLFTKMTNFIKENL